MSAADAERDADAPLIEPTCRRERRAFAMSRREPSAADADEFERCFERR